MNKNFEPITSNSLLMAEWDFNKNIGLDPDKIPKSDRKKVWWKCRITGYEWKASPDSRRKSKDAACNACVKLVDKSILEKAAHLRGGKVTVTNYRGISEKYLWECALGHQWWASGTHVIHHTSWCPECSNGSSEKICRAYFEKIFGSTFPKTKPEWLKTEQGNQLELDGYNASLGIAFEHNGKQHYEDIYKNEELFTKLVKNDYRKKKLCIENGVILIVIPELKVVTKIKNLLKFIVEECIKNNVHIPMDVSFKDIDLSIAIVPDFLKFYTKCSEFAKNKNGKIISDYYLGCNVELEWFCNIHQLSFKSTSTAVFSENKWCPICCKKSVKEKQWKSTQRRMLEKCSQFAISRNGKLISTQYYGPEVKLEWFCNVHQVSFMAKPGLVLKCESWCKICGKIIRFKNLKKW